LINVSECDVQLARLIEGGRSLVVEFTAQLIRKSVIDEQVCTPSDFTTCVDILSRLIQLGKASDMLEQQSLFLFFPNSISFSIVSPN
jgi:hypothetical protein